MISGFTKRTTMSKLSVLLIAVSISASAQSYTVIHSIGKILDTKSGKYLVKGSRINESASLMFETKGARAAVLSTTRGRFVIQEKSSAASESDVVYALSSVISPVRGRLSTRAGGINNKLDFEKYFGEGPIAILGDLFSVQVSSTAYPMNEQKFFYAQYQYEGEAINKKLSNEGDKLIVSATEFYAIDGKAIDPKEVNDIKLYYYNAESQESAMITAMNFSIVSREDLTSIASQMDGDTEAIVDVISSLYGKCSQAYLEENFRD